MKKRVSRTRAMEYAKMSVGRANLKFEGQTSIAGEGGELVQLFIFSYLSDPVAGMEKPLLTRRWQVYVDGEMQAGGIVSMTTT